MHIRQAENEPACAACSVIRRSITELCHADHGGDEAFLGKWLSNKSVENVARRMRQSHFLRVQILIENGRLYDLKAAAIPI
jgi:hypothetical protein